MKERKGIITEEIFTGRTKSRISKIKIISDPLKLVVVTSAKTTVHTSWTSYRNVTTLYSRRQTGKNDRKSSARQLRTGQNNKLPSST